MAASHQFTLPLHRACNQGCGFCTDRGENAAPVLQRADRARRAVGAAAARGVSHLVLTGGEPLLEPYAVRLLEDAKKAGILHCTVETNGTVASLPGVAQRLRDAGLDCARVALNSWNAADNDAVTGDAGGTARTFAGIQALLQAGVGVVLVVPLVPANRGALAEIVAHARARFAVGKGVQGVVARPILQPARGEPALGIPAVAAELTAGYVSAQQPGGLPLTVAAESALPACAYVDVAAVAGLLRLGPTLVVREAAAHVRLAMCADCAFAGVCPGVATVVHATWQPSAPVARAFDQAAAPAFEVEHIATEIDPFASLGLDTVPGAAMRARLTEPLPHQTWASTFPGHADREALELATGLRSLIRRELPRAEQAREVEKALQKQGFKVNAVASELLGAVGRPRVHVFAAQTEAVLQEAAALDQALGAAPALRNRAMQRYGALFGYPPCCVQAYVTAEDQSDGALLARLACLHTGPLHPWQNYAVVPLRLMSFYPCSPDCTAAERVALASLRALQQAAPAWATAVAQWLAAPLLVQAFDRVALFPGGRCVWREGTAVQVVDYTTVTLLADLGLDAGVADRLATRAFAAAVGYAVRLGRELARGPRSLVISRAGEVAETLRFRDKAPFLLDFSGNSTVGLPD